MPEHKMLFVYDGISPMREVLLDRGLYAIGRKNSCDIVINRPGVSRLHATIVFIEQDEYNPSEKAHHLIIDGDAEIDGGKSSLGLYVNGIRVDSHKLRHDDTIELGENSRHRGIYLKYFAFYQAGEKSAEGATSL